MRPGWGLRIDTISQSPSLRVDTISQIQGSPINSDPLSQCAPLLCVGFDRNCQYALGGVFALTESVKTLPCAVTQSVKLMASQSILTL